MRLIVKEVTGEELLDMNYPSDPAHNGLSPEVAEQGFAPVAHGLISTYVNGYAVVEENWLEWPTVTITMKEENTMNTTTNPMMNNLEEMRLEEEGTTMLSRANNLQTKTAARDLIREMGVEVSNTSYKTVWKKESLIHTAIQCAKEYDLNGDDGVGIVYQGYYDMVSHGTDITQYPLAHVTFTEEAVTGHVSASAASAPVEEKAEGMAPKGDETNDDHSFEKSSEPTIDELKAELAHALQCNQLLAQERDDAIARLQKGINMYNGLKAQYNALVDAHNKLKASHDSQRNPETVTNNHSNRISSQQPKASTCSCGTEISYKNSKFSRKISSQYPPQYRDHDYCLYCQRALIATGKPLTHQDILDGKHTTLPSVDMKAVLARVNKNSK